MKRTNREAIAYILEKKAQKGKKYPRVTNTELLNLTRKDRIGKAGINLAARGQRESLRKELERDHGLSLIPDTAVKAKKTWKIVPVELGAIYLLVMRLRKVEKLIMNSSRGMSTLKKTAIEYQANEYVNPAFRKYLQGLQKSMEAVELVGEETLLPRMNRMLVMLADAKEEEDEEQNPMGPEKKSKDEDED